MSAGRDPRAVVVGPSALPGGGQPRACSDSPCCTPAASAVDQQLVGACRPIPLQPGTARSGPSRHVNDSNAAHPRWCRSGIGHYRPPARQPRCSIVMGRWCRPIPSTGRSAHKDIATFMTGPNPVRPGCPPLPGAQRASLRQGRTPSCRHALTRSGRRAHFLAEERSFDDAPRAARRCRRSLTWSVTTTSPLMLRSRHGQRGNQSRRASGHAIGQDSEHKERRGREEAHE